MSSAYSFITDILKYMSSLKNETENNVNTQRNKQCHSIWILWTQKRDFVGINRHPINRIQWFRLEGRGKMWENISRRSNSPNPLCGIEFPNAGFFSPVFLFCFLFSSSQGQKYESGIPLSWEMTSDLLHLQTTYLVSTKRLLASPLTVFSLSPPTPLCFSLSISLSYSQ